MVEYHYEVVVPSHYNVKKVIVGFPGITGKAAKFTKMFAKQQDKFIGIYFDTPTGGWNYDRDVTKVIEIIQREIAELTTLTEINIVGVSSGAVFALTIAAKKNLGDLNVFAVAGTLVKPLVKIAGSSIKPPRVIMLNGMEDNSTPYKGGFAHKMDLAGVEDSATALSSTGKLYKTEANSIYEVRASSYSTSPNIELHSVIHAGHDVWTYFDKYLKMQKDSMANQVIEFFENK